jgi:hypothetical protein
LIEDKYGEGAIRAMAESGSRLREDDSALGFLAERIFRDISTQEAEAVVLDREAMLAMPRALQRRMLEMAVGHVRDRSGGIEAALDGLAGLHASSSDKRFAVASGIEISIAPDAVRVGR